MHTDAEKEQIKQFAEEDAINFANTVCILAEFVSTLPEYIKELKISIACGDRLQRDLLVCSIRALSCQPTGATTNERMKVFPWISDSGEKILADVQDLNSDKDLQLRLRALEDENVSLKRERNELTLQIMAQREASIIASMQPSSSHARAQLSSQTQAAAWQPPEDALTLSAWEEEDSQGDLDESQSTAFTPIDNETAVLFSKSPLTLQEQEDDIPLDNSSNVSDLVAEERTSEASGRRSWTAAAESSDGNLMDNLRTLTAKVIDLENKLKIAGKREV
jgi:hypothetical protein